MTAPLIDNPVSDALQEVVDQYIHAFPHRTVTQSWKNRDDYNHKQLTPGILTIIYGSKVQGNDPYNAYFKFMVVGRVYCGDKATGLEVQQTELVFSDELESLAQSGVAGNFIITEISYSSQMEIPHGWFIAKCTMGPLDLSHYNNDETPANVDKLMLGQAPDIGLGHEADYDVITAGE